LGGGTSSADQSSKLLNRELNRELFVGKPYGKKIISFSSEEIIFCL